MIRCNLDACHIHRKDGHVVIEWMDGHKSAYDVEWLRRYDYSEAARQRRRAQVEPWMWSRAELSSLPKVDYNAIHTDAGTMVDHKEPMCIGEFGMID